MPKAIRTDSVNNRTIGFAMPGLYRDEPATVEHQVHDGDTLSVRPDGDIGVRLLGIDTPEVSFSFPGQTFLDLSDPQWNDFLRTPFDERWGAFSRPVPEELKSWIQSRVSGMPGSDHHLHSQHATNELRQMVQSDMNVMGKDLATFRYYMNFGFEVMDGYGRFLCMINRNQPERNNPAPRPPTYNLRMLERGRAFPYFIWPNVNPWERPESIEKAVIPAGKAAQLARDDRELSMARRFVQSAREQHRGIFDSMTPLLLEPFELRYLSRRELPGRYVIDLASDSNTLIPPLQYFRVANPEDRLWIPSIYVPLFEKAGWRVG